jgi:thiamine biosynthesis lipoprotein
LAVDDTFLDVLEAAAGAVRRTDGRFDPAVLPALEAAGYDRSIELVPATADLVPCRPRPTMGRDGWQEVRIDRDRGEVALPPRMRIDLGGIAKGAFVDRLAAELTAWPGGSIDAGGDLWIWGEPPGGAAWAVSIENSCQPESDLFAAEVPPGAGLGIATSATHRRRWRIGGGEAHHLIDPQTGSPLVGEIRGATAFAPTVTAAEIAAKALLIAATEPPIVDLFGAAAGILSYAGGQVEVLAESLCHDRIISVLTPLTSISSAA